MEQCYSYWIILWVFLMLSACSTPHYMYAPTAVNVPGFTKKNDASVTAALSANGFDLQGGYALSDHWAILGSWYWRRAHEAYEYVRSGLFLPRTTDTTFDNVYYYRNLISVSGAYYTPLDSSKKYFLSVQAGYGRGRLRMNEHHVLKGGDTIVANQFFHFQSRMNRILFQPSIMRKGNNLDIIFSLRLSGMIYNHILSDYPPSEIELANNKLYVFSEPAFTFIIQPDLDWLRIRLQFGMAIPPENMSFEMKPFIGNVGLAFYPDKWFSQTEE